MVYFSQLIHGHMQSWEEVHQFTIKEYQQKLKELESENKELQTQLAEAETGRSSEHEI